MAKKRDRVDPGDGAREAAGETAPARSFEEEFQAAQDAVDLLERGDLSLESTLKEYEKGLKALASCHAILSRAKKRIEVLACDAGLPADGSPQWSPADTVPVLKEAILQIERTEEVPLDRGDLEEADPDESEG